MIPGETSTGSKRSGALWGSHLGPVRMTRAHGCYLWDAEGREYIDTIMALGAVVLGYGYPAVTEAVERAARDGAVGSLAPVLEEEVADRLGSWMQGGDAVRFFKTGAEAVSAAVRIARVATGRDHVVSCGYHGWLDWSQDAVGVPAAVRALHRTIPFNDHDVVVRLGADDCRPAALVVEPVIDEAPTLEWMSALRETADCVGAVLVFDEIKTGFRLGWGGAAARYGVQPHLTVLGKGLGNGYPLAAVIGPAELMGVATRTWISSTLATEYVSLAAARAVIETCEHVDVAAAVARGGERLWSGLTRVAAEHGDIVTGVRGIPEMCYLTFRDDALSAAVASCAAARGLLFKRSAYNFVSLAHDDAALEAVLERLDAAVAEVETRC